MGVLAVSLRAVTSNITISLSSDVLVLIVFGVFALGVHFGGRRDGKTVGAGRGTGIDLEGTGTETTSPTTISSFERRASTLGVATQSAKMLLQDTDADAGGGGAAISQGLHGLSGYGSPLPQFPSNGTCWSRPDEANFRVRGPNYKQDKVKVPSKPGFDLRGVDLFLTDNAMHNIGRHPAIMGGKLKEKSSFVINFLLPWGNLVAAWEIPDVNSDEKGFGKAWKHFMNGSQKER